MMNVCVLCRAASCLPHAAVVNVVVLITLSTHPQRLHACSAAGGCLRTSDELKKCRQAANDEMDVGLHGWVHPGAAVT